MILSAKQNKCYFPSSNFPCTHLRRVHSMTKLKADNITSYSALNKNFILAQNNETEHTSLPELYDTVRTVRNYSSLLTYIMLQFTNENLEKLILCTLKNKKLNQKQQIINTILKFSYQKRNPKSWFHGTDIHPTQQKSRNAPHKIEKSPWPHNHF